MNSRTYISLGLSFLAALNLSAAPDTVDTSFTDNAGVVFTPNVTGGIASVIVQPNGKIIYGSNEMAATVNSNPLALSLTRFNPDGTVDHTFGADNHAMGSDAGIYYDGTGWPEVHTLGLQSGGKIIAAGVMQGYRTGTVAAPGTTHVSNNILRFNADGSIDTTFQSAGTQAWPFGGFNYIEEVTIAPDDKIICVGGFGGFRDSTSDPYTTRYGIARLNANGSLDTTFQIDPAQFGVPGGAVFKRGFFRQAAVDTSGKIYVVGQFEWGNTFPAPSIPVFARLFPDGKRDYSFNPVVPANVDSYNGVVVEPNGNVMVLAGLDNSGGGNASWMGRLLLTGGTDTSFNLAASLSTFTARPLRRAPNGKYLLSRPGSHVQDNLVRVNSNGTLDATFSVLATFPTTSDIPYMAAWAHAPNGKIYSGNFFSRVQSTDTSKVVAFEGDYVASSTGTINLVLGSAQALEDGGAFMVEIRRSGGVTGAASVVLNTANSSATAGADYTAVSGTSISWAAGEGGSKYVMVPILSDSDVESAETFSVTIGSAAGASLGNSTGIVTILDADTAPVITAQPMSVAVNGGQTATFSVSAESASSLTFQWRKNSVDIPGATSNTYTTPNLSVSDDGNTYGVVITNAAGSVTSSAATVQVLVPDGTADGMYNVTGLTGPQYLKTLPDGTSYVVQGVHGAYSIKKILPDGSIDGTYTSAAITQGGFGASFWATALQSDGKLVIRGNFDAVGGVSRPGLARLNANGTLDGSFAPNLTGYAAGFEVYALPSGVYLRLKPTGQSGGLARLTDTGAIDGTFVFGTNTNKFLEIKDMFELPNGQLIVGYLKGLGSSVSGWGITRLDVNGDEDANFNAYKNTNGMSGFPQVVTHMSDGRIAISDGSSLKVLFADGTLDPSFATPVTFSSAIKVITENKGHLIVGGNFTDLNGTSVNRIVRLDSTGNHDATFPGGQGADGEVNSITQTTSGHLIIGGSFINYNSEGRIGIARLVMDDPVVAALAGTANEEDGTASVTIRRYGDFTAAMSVDLATANGTAIAGSDYTALTQTVSWLAGNSDDQVIAITLNDDSDIEGDENFLVNLSNVVGGITSTPGSSIVIKDGDSLPSITAQSSSQDVVEGTNASLSVTATSPSPILYQWYKDGVAIGGATATSYSITGAVAGDAGSYTVILTNDYGTLVSQEMVVNVISDPTAIAAVFTNASPVVGSSIWTIAPAPDGGLYIGGDFTDVGSDPARDYLVKINEDGSLDTTFNPPTLTGRVRDIVVADDGSLIVVGDFTGRVTKLAATGVEDSVFKTNIGTSANSQVSAAAILSDGTIAIAGRFTQWNGVTLNPRGPLVHLNADGTNASVVFNSPKTRSNILKLLALPGNELLIAYDNGFNSYMKLGRLGSDGELDLTNFNYVETAAAISDIALALDGTYLIAGNSRLRKVNTDGSVAVSYNTSSTWYAVAGQVNGKVIGGGFSAPRIGRYLASGSSDPAFAPSPGFNNRVQHLALRPDGKIWVAGWFTTYNSISAPSVVLLDGDEIPLAIINQPAAVTVDAGLAAVFDCSATGTTAISYQWQRNGVDLVDGGNVSGATTTQLTITNVQDADEGVIRCIVSNAAGSETSDAVGLVALAAPEIISISPDTSAPEGSTLELVVEAIGAGSLSYQWKLAGVDLPGEIGSSLSLPSLNMADAGAYTVTITNTLGDITSGAIQVDVTANPAAIDPGFTPLTMNGNIHAVLPLPGNKALVGGSFTSISDGVNTSGANLAVVNEDGTVEIVAGLSADNRVYCISEQADGKILIGGSFNTVNGVTRQKVARLNANLTLDATFNPATTNVVGDVRDVVELSGGKIMVGGSFVSWDNIANTAYCARLTTTGAHDSTFVSGAASWVLGVLPQSNGDLIISGWFWNWGGDFDGGYLARVDSAGALVSVPDYTGVSSATTMAQLADGRVLFGDSSFSRFRLYNNDGSADGGFLSGDSLNNSVEAITVSSNHLYVGGNFTTLGSGSLNRLARMSHDGVVDTSFFVGTGPDGTVDDIAETESGKIWVAGSFLNYQGSAARSLILLKGDPVISPYSAWVASNGLTSGQDQLGHNPDGDYFSNGLEFLYGMDPTKYDYAPVNISIGSPSVDGGTLNALPSVSGLDPSKTYATYQYRVPKDKKGLTVEVKASLDLLNMNNGSAQAHEYGTPVDEGDYEVRSYYFTPSLTDQPTIFWRLSVSE